MYQITTREQFINSLLPYTPSYRVQLSSQG
jgi:hypothetical protein